MNKILRVIETISSASGWLSGLGVFVMLGIISIDVPLRYFFGRPLLISDEVSVYSMIFIAFIGAALTMKMGRHVSVDILWKALPRKVQLWLDVVTSYVGTVIMAIMSWQTIVWAIWVYHSGRLSAGIMETPMWIPQSFIPIGLFLWTMQYIVECVKTTKALKSYHLNDVEGGAANA
jgi:TRAP-type C4-dicarboxylate transport system permease small subunit